MPQQLIDTLILSMGRRCETCLALVALDRQEDRFAYPHVLAILDGKRHLEDRPLDQDIATGDVVPKHQRRLPDTGLRVPRNPDTRRTLSSDSADTTVISAVIASRREGTTDRRGRSHSPQCNTSREDRQIVHTAVTDRSVTSRTIAQHIESVTHHSVSIRRRLQ
ncbi:transposable element Tcb1 transposase [Trichonephila clavipes]|uniref:Transposable element Tcb1 transposase n=1 Tax=Trichonephila clavipes TaxID=2585209 RepID=A0A8X6W5A9_TRICX|nr:transposable element Tcb1 transposase [Trichonephila clavipes]